MAYAVLFLFAENLSEVRIEEVIGPLGHALTVAAGLLLGAGLILRDLRRGALLATAVVAFWFGFGHLARLLGPGVSRDVQLANLGVLVRRLGGSRPAPRLPWKSPLSPGSWTSS